MLFSRRQTWHGAGERERERKRERERGRGRGRGRRSERGSKVENSYSVFISINYIKSRRRWMIMKFLSRNPSTSKLKLDSNVFSPFLTSKDEKMKREETNLSVFLGDDGFLVCMMHVATDHHRFFFVIIFLWKVILTHGNHWYQDRKLRERGWENKREREILKCQVTSYWIMTEIVLKKSLPGFNIKFE